MGQGYQDRDCNIIDYELYKLAGFARPFRGPKPNSLDDKSFFVCVGAAQTFGCYAPIPYPQILSRKLNMPVLNFGVAGAGPSFFLKRQMFISEINKARFAVIQVLSGRSESNSLFTSNGGEMLTRVCDGKSLGAAPAYAELLRSGDSHLLSRTIYETKENWVVNMQSLMSSIVVPKILFWFSERRVDDYELSYNNVHDLFGKFPQMVDDNMMDEIRPYADHYIETVSAKGLPQQLFNRFTGMPTSIKTRQDLGGDEKHFNDYYPSPEMHVDAANDLAGICAGLASEE